MTESSPHPFADPPESSPDATEQAPPVPAAATPMEHARTTLRSVQQAIGSVVAGQDGMIEQMLVALICGGHALLEGVPGTAKTLAVRAMAAALDCQTKRIQFTPDLMPSDIVGTNVFNLQDNSFELRRGPVFTDLLLADEINRAPAKTQSALLEAMSESAVTIDGVRYPLSAVFTVFATQNPVEFEGTYPLPEAQQDRFLLKIRIGYPSRDAELAVLEAVDAGAPRDQHALAQLQPLLNIHSILNLRQSLAALIVEPGVRGYVLDLVRATRDHESVVLGAGPRGSIALLQCAKARALLQGRDYLTPDDVVAMVEPVLGHRITLAADAEISGVTTADVLSAMLDQIDVPR